LFSPPRRRDTEKKIFIRKPGKQELRIEILESNIDKEVPNCNRPN
jgi:hypothetical protein